MKNPQTLYYSILNSPIGKLLLVGTTEHLLEIRFENSWDESDLTDFTKEDSLFTEAITQLNEYFTGKRKDFSLPLSPQGTDFQQKVWSELQSIPYGTTTSYGEIAKRIENPKGSRAVGLANGKNPIPIIIPCHRVIGKNGKLTGFGGGLDIKQHLLEIEKLSSFSPKIIAPVNDHP